MASITVDIQAKVVGYEASLKAMKDAFSKIDPGSDIGKSLEKAIKYAENQLKNLGKNLTPKASSDTQIDSIVEKTNRAGEAIQEVTRLMQKVSVGDIDFSSFENGIGKLMGTLRDLETELDSRISNGLRQTIAGSTELTDAFSKLDIDVKGKSAGEIFEAISEKAKKAAADTEDAQTKLETAEKNLSAQQGKLNKIESNPIYNKDTLEQDLQNIAVEYTKTFDDIKAKIQEGLRSLLGSDSTQADELMKNFMNGLNPQTLKDHLMQLKNALQQELTQNNSAKDIYSALLGDDGSGGNAQAIATKLLSGLNQALPQVKEELQSKVQEFISSLTNKEAGQITTLINLGDIENAVKTTIQAIERAYASIKGAAAKQRTEVLRAMEGKETAQTNFNMAQQNQQDIEGIKADLQGQINKLLDENNTLKADIAKLRSEIDEKKNAETTKIRQAAAESNTKTNNLKIAADEARMYSTELGQVQAKEKLIGKIEGVVQRWFSIYAAVRMVGNAIRSVISTVKELDKTITEIAIVTNMTQNELWGQMKSYTDMARQYAASISGVYQVSQLYYQQGLQTADVMALTEETLKMARISGLGYAEATDYMTNAVRSFKMEMTDAQRVVDVYSEIAASSATSTSELASAMSKTASSAAAVGSSFENTTAMMAVMIEATREAPENIGSALKSIISRYGEMKADPTKLIDSEGQEMSLNKVDKALQSVGISIQDANHQFRDFDDVITELAGKWDTIDTNTQRYIATVMAGNRQQSRFLALVSNGERLEELSEKAANSEDAATLQVLKTMDSIEAKSQQLKTSLQSLYTSTGIQNLFKGFLDIGNQIVKTFTQMPTVFGAPIPAILKIGTTFASLANVVTTVFGLIKAKTQAQIAALNGQEQTAATERVGIAEQEITQKMSLEGRHEVWYQAYQNALTKYAEKGEAERLELAAKEAQAAEQLYINNAQKNPGGITKKSAGAALGLNIAGVALSTLAGAMSDKTQTSKIFKGLTGIAGSTASMAGMGMMMGHPLIGAALGAVMGVIENINFLWESAETRAQRLKEAATEANNTYLQKKNDYTSYQDEINKLKELKKARYDSKEANEEYIESSNRIAEQHPELVTSFDAEGNAVLDLAASYNTLEEARQAAIESGANAAEASIKLAQVKKEEAERNRKAAADEVESFYNPQNVSLVQTDIRRILYDELSKESGSGVTLKEDGYHASQEIKEAIDYFATQLSTGSVTVEDAYTRALQSVGIEAELVSNLFKNFDIGLGTGGAQTSFDYVKLMGYGQGEGAFINDIIENIELGNADEVIKLTRQYSSELENLGTSLYANNSLYRQFLQDLSEYTGIIIAADSDVEKAENQIKLQERSGVAALTRDYMYGDENDNKKNTDFFKEFDEVNTLISGYVYDKFTEYKDGLIKQKEEGKISQKEVDDAFKNFDSAGMALDAYNEIYSIIEGIWKNASDSQKEQFNNLLGKSGNYSKAQFGEELQKIFPRISDELVQQLQEQYYNTAYSFSDYVEALTSRYQNQDFELLGSRQAELLQSLGSNELQQVLSIYDDVAAQIKAKNITPEIGQQAFDSYLAVWNATTQLDNKSREVAQDVLSKVDFSSLTGLDELRASLEAAGLNEDIIKSLMGLATTFAQLMPENLIVDFETLSKNMVSQTEDFEKALKSASDGMGLEEATKMADKLKVSISDFRFEGGKYFTDDAQAIKDAYYKYNEETLAELNNQYIKERTEILRKIQLYKNEGQDDSELRTKLTDLDTANANLQAAIKQYGEYQVNAILIQNGKIEDFLKSFQNKEGEQLYSDEEISDFITSIESGDFENLPKNIKQYTSELWNVYKDAGKSVYESAINSIFNGRQLVEVDATNIEALSALLNRQDLKNGDQVWLDFANNIVGLREAILNNVKLTPETKRSLLSSLESKATELDNSTILKDVASSYEDLSYEVATKYARLLGAESLEEFLASSRTEISVNESGQYIADYNALWSKILNNQNLTLKERNEALASMAEQKQSQSDTAILSTIIQNRDKLNEENVAALATMLKTSYDVVIDAIHDNADGTYAINLAQLTDMLNKGNVEVSDAVTDLIANQINIIISSVTGLAGSQSKGFTDLENMQKYVTSLREKGVTINGEEASLANLFEYNESLRAYQFTTSGIIANIIGNKDEIDKLRAQLAQTTDSDEKARLQEQIDVAQTFIENSVKEFADAIDISAYLNTDFGSAASAQAMSNIVQAIANYNAALEALGKNTILNIDAIVDALGQGGQSAVIAAQTIADIQGTTLSAEEIESLYRREVASLVNAIDGVVAQPGEIVDAVTAQIIGFSNVQQIGNSGQYVVKTAANLYEAYDNLLKKMAATGEATLADLNKVAALALENRDGEQVIIDALGDAASMTYTRFGEILAQEGIELSEDLVDTLTKAGIIKQLGGANMAITDFQGFADLMGWEAGSEQYVSAFKTYNDSLIEMNRQAESNILEEAKSLSSAKGGDWINLTQLSNELEKQVASVTQEGGNAPIIKTGLDRLNEALQKYGAQIEDGILKLGPSANIPAIMQEITQAAAESGGLLANEMAELADTVADAIKSYADLIKNGISGSLSNVQAEQLQDWADSVGIGELTFTETADGLKIATDQAFELVAALQQVDSMQGKLVFNDLVDALSADKGGQFENISKTTAEIAKLEKSLAVNERELQELRLQGIDSSSETYQNLQKQNSSLREQINLAKQIQQRQSIDPSQYNFMDRDLPDVMQGPINYWNSVGKAYAALNDAGKTGKMEIQDFTNIVNEMSNLAQISGQKMMFFGQEIDGSAETAAALIQKGYSALSNVDGKGVKIDLSKMGIDFAAGADNAKNNFDKGVQSLAKAQIAMLDAAIRVLEIVVAMESLGDIDVDSDNQLDLGEIFTLDDSGIPTDWNEKFQEVSTNLLKRAEADDDLSAALDSVKISGTSMRQMLEAARDGIDLNSDEFKALNLSYEEYQQVMDGFYQAMLNGDYDLDTIQDSVWDILNQTLPDGTVIEIGDRTIIVSGGSSVAIDWDSEGTKAGEKLLEDKLTDDVETTRQALQNAYIHYQNGKADNIEIEAVLTSKGVIKINPDGGVDIGDEHFDNTDNTEAQSAIAKAALKDSGFDNIDNIKAVKVDGEWNVTAEATANIGNKVVKVNYSNGEITYHSNVLNQDFSSVNDLMRAEYDKRIEELQWAQEHGGVDASNIVMPTYEQFVYQTYGIIIDTSTTFTDADGNEITDPANNFKLKQEVTDFLQQSNQKIGEYFETEAFQGDAGHWTLKLPGGDLITVDAESAEEAQAKILEQMKTIFAPMSDAISIGITDAFTSSDSGVADAIGQAIVNAISNFDVSKMPEEPTIPELKASISQLNITGVDNTNFGSGGLLGAAKNILGASDLVIPSASAKINTLNITGVDIVQAESIAQQIVQAIQTALDNKPVKVSATGTPTTPTPETSETTQGVTAVINKIDDTLIKNSDQTIEVNGTIKSEQINTELNQLANENISPIAVPVTADDQLSNDLTTIKTDAGTPVDMPINADADGSAKNTISQLNSDASSPVSKDVKVGVTLPAIWDKLGADITKTVKIQVTGDKVPAGSAKGNVALAKGISGEAHAGGTLMGELGPELVVSKGRYFVVGQNGPEMVSLADDAIVFNHLQTEKLLTNGKVNSRGRPVTNERKATSLATGNASGPAMASASAALAALKQLRAMWQSLADASLKDLGGMPGGSGGGGGGGGGNDAKAVKSVTQQVERWYNWIKEIESLQENINKLTKEYNLLEKQGLATENKLANLRAQYEKRQQSQVTRSQYAEEQRKYRASEIDRVNKGLMGAFYYADSKTGRVYLANDDNKNAYFAEFLKSEQGQKANGKLTSLMRSSGKIAAGTTLNYQDVYSQSDADAEAEKEYQQWLTTKKGQKASNKAKEKQKKKIQNKYNKKIGSKIDKTLTTQFDIRTGADFMNELQRKNEVGENVHNAREQWELIQAMGFEDLLPQIKAGIDTSEEGWEEQAVENFYNAIDADKEAIESLTESIEEQEQAALEDAEALQEINEQIRELAQPLTGVTDSLEEWYNELKRVEAIQTEINRLQQINSNYQQDQIANGHEIYNNYKLQVEQLQQQAKLNQDLINKREKERANTVKKYEGLPISYDAKTGKATFNDTVRKLNMNTSYTDVKTTTVNGKKYLVDTDGNYVDDTGILRNSAGQELKNKRFGEQATTTITQKVNLTGTFSDIIKQITSQDATGKVAYNATQQYQILKQLVPEKYLQYDENGKKLYDEFGEITKEEQEAIVKAAISRIQKAADDINDQTSEINSLTEENLNIQGSILDIQNTLRDNSIEVQNLMKDAVQQEHQDAIDQKKELKDAIKDAADKTISGLRDNLEKDKTLYEGDKNKEELGNLQMQLSILRNTNGSISKIRDLQQKIQDKQKDIYFDERELAIDELEDTAQKQVEALEQQTELMQTALDYQVKYGLIWDEVNRKLSVGSDDSIADYILKNTPEFLAANREDQVKQLVEAIEKISMFEDYRRDGGIQSSLASLKHYAQGGIIDYTGPAWVDGTKTKPEYVFSSSQMDTLRQGLLNNVNLTGTLVSSMLSTLNNLPDANTYSSINNNNDDSIIIEHAVVNVNVQEVSSDYDSRKIGEQALNEMVRIARKVGSRNVSRR